MKTLRRTLLIIFSVVMVTGLSMMFLSAAPAKALSVSVSDNLSVEPGASIRLTTDGNDAGLRFKAKMTEALYDETIADGAYTDADGTFGMIIVPESYVTDYEAQKEGGEADFIAYLESAKGGKMVNLTFGAEKIYSEGDGYCYTGSIVNLYLQNYNVKFRATAYYYDGAAYSYSAAGDSRSVVQVASAILNGDYSEYEEAGVADALEDYAIGGELASLGYTENEEGQYVLGDNVYDSFDQIPNEDYSDEYTTFDEKTSTATVEKVYSEDGGWYQVVKADPDTNFANMNDAPGANGFWNNLADFYFPTTKFEAVEGGGYLTFDFKTSASSDRIAISFVIAEGTLTERFYVFNPGSEWMTFSTFGAYYSGLGASKSCIHVRIYALPATDWEDNAAEYDKSDVWVAINNMKVHSYTEEDLAELSGDMSDGVRGYQNVKIEPVKKDNGGQYQLLTAINSDSSINDIWWPNSVEIFVNPTGLTTENMEISFMKGAGTGTTVRFLFVYTTGQTAEVSATISAEEGWNTVTLGNSQIVPVGASLGNLHRIRVNFSPSSQDLTDAWLAIDNLKFVTPEA